MSDIRDRFRNMEVGEERTAKGLEKTDVTEAISFLMECGHEDDENYIWDVHSWAEDKAYKAFPDVYGLTVRRVK